MFDDVGEFQSELAPVSNQKQQINSIAQSQIPYKGPMACKRGESRNKIFKC